MAIKTITQYTDDFDGSSEGVETVKFALGGANYEIDLSKANQDKLEAALQPFLAVARRAAATTGSGRRAASSPRAAGGSSGSGTDAKAVRAWAAENGITVPPRGRIPGAVIEQYQAAGH